MLPLILTVMALLFLMSILYKMHSVSRGWGVDYISFWVLNYIVFCFCGAVVIMLGAGDDIYFVLPFSHNEYLKLVGSSVVIFLGGGAIICFFFFFRFLGGEKPYIKLNSTTVLYSKRDVFICDLALLFSLGIFIYCQYSIYPSPLLMAISGESTVDIALRRIQVTKDLAEIASTYPYAILKILLHVLTFSYIASFVLNKNMINAIRFVFVFLLSIISLLSTAEKGPIIFYLGGTLMSYYFSRGVILKISFKLILISIFFLICVYVIFVSTDIATIFSLIFDRVFIAQISAVYLSLEHYSWGGDIGFASMNNLFTKLMSYKSQSAASEELMRVYFPEMISLGGWNINGLYIHEAWSNFGVIGLLIGPLLVGFENALLLRYIVSFNKTPLLCGFYSLFSISCTSFLTSFNSYFYDSNWLVYLVVVSLFSCFYVIYLLLHNVQHGIKMSSNIS